MKLSAATAQPTEQRNRYVVRQTLGNLALAEEYEKPEVTGVSSLRFAPGLEVGFLSQEDLRRFLQLSLSSATAISNVAVFGVSEVGNEIGTAPKINIESIITRKITEAVDRLLAIAKDEKFQDGVDSNLSLGLAALIKRHPDVTMNVIKEAVAARDISYLVFAEILQFLGRVEDEPTKESRFVLLISTLWHKSPLVRDAASVGLAYMNDQRAVSHLRKAIEVESVPSLREDLQSIVQELED